MEEDIKQGLDKIYDLLNVACGNCIIEDNERDSLQNVIYNIENLLNRLKYLETGIKELIEKDFKAVFEGNGDFPDTSTEMQVVKYVKVEKLEKLLKGE